MVLVTQSCPILCNPMDCSPPGCSVHEILQARILPWVAISFPRGSSQPRNQTWASCIAGRFFTIWSTRYLLETSLYPSNPTYTNTFANRNSKNYDNKKSHHLRECLLCARNNMLDVLLVFQKWESGCSELLTNRPQVTELLCDEYSILAQSYTLQNSIMHLTDSKG